MIGQNINKLREEANRSVEDLANVIGITRQTFYRYEKEEINPSPEVVEKLSLVFGVQIEDFFKKESTESLKNINFRSNIENASFHLSGVEKETIEVLNIQSKLEDLVNENNNFIRPSFKTKVTSLSAIEDIVTELRNEWKLGEAPILSLTDLLENNNIRVVERFSSYNFEGVSAFHDNKPLIVLNTKTTEVTRKRFTLAHELCHILLNDTLENSNLKDKIEEACDVFAGALLLPKNVIIKVFNNNDVFSMQDFINIKEKYGISIIAIWVRARSLGLITWETYHTWKQTYENQNNYGTYSIVERPKKIEEMLIKSINKGLLKVEEAVEFAKKVNDKLENVILFNKKLMMNNT